MAGPSPRSEALRAGWAKRPPAAASLGLAGVVGALGLLAGLQPAAQAGPVGVPLATLQAFDAVAAVVQADRIGVTVALGVAVGVLTVIAAAERFLRRPKADGPLWLRLLGDAGEILSLLPLTWVAGYWAGAWTPLVIARVAAAAGM